MNNKILVLYVFIIGLLLVPSSGFGFVDINYAEFSDLSNLILGDNARNLNTDPDNILQLTSGTWQRSGYAYSEDQFQLRDTFSTYFTFRISNNVRSCIIIQIFIINVSL